MQLVRAPIALDPRTFGRRTRGELPSLLPTPASRRSSDLKLFASTFLAGFVFVSVLLA
jgi:hypothetical protein